MKSTAFVVYNHTVMNAMYGKSAGSPYDTRPIDSATVILVRNRDRGDFEIFLMKRHSGQDFMGGAYVFPGGKVESSDRDEDLFRMAPGLSPRDAMEALRETDISPEKALGIFFAALRETFEEAGVLTARNANGETVGFENELDSDKFSDYRLRIYNNEISLHEMAQRENITYAPELLIPYSHWITPAIESKRFDTRFLLAKMLKGQEPVHCSIEMTKSVWLTPASALEKHVEGSILLMPPTLKTVEELDRFQNIDELFKSAENNDIPVILPQPFIFEGGFGVKLPHDPEYTIEEYKLPPDSDDGPSRIVLIDGKWSTARFD